MSSPSADAEGQEVSVETLKKRNAILKGGVVRLQTANQALETRVQELQAKQVATEELLTQRTTETKAYQSQVQRLEKRCQRLAAELQEAKDSGRQSRGLLGGVFASGPDPQLLALKDELEVTREELEQKIRENEGIHIQLFEERRTWDTQAKALQSKQQALEAEVLRQQKQNAQLQQELHVAQSEEQRLLGLAATLRQELLAAEDTKSECHRLQRLVQHYVHLLQSHGILDDTRNTAFADLSLNVTDYRKERKALINLQGIFVALRTLAAELQSMCGGAAERLHAILSRISGPHLDGHAVPTGDLQDLSAPKPLTQLRDEIRSSNAGMSQASSELMELCQKFLCTLKQELSHLSSGEKEITSVSLVEKLRSSTQRWLQWVASSLRLLVAAITISPLSPNIDISPPLQEALGHVVGSLQSLVDFPHWAHRNGGADTKDLLKPLMNSWTALMTSIQKVVQGQVVMYDKYPAIKSIDLSIAKASSRVLQSLGTLAVPPKPVDGTEHMETSSLALDPVPPSSELCSADQLSGLPPGYLESTCVYVDATLVKAQLRRQCHKFLQTKEQHPVAYAKDDVHDDVTATADQNVFRPSYSSSSELDDMGFGGADLQDMDWDHPCIAIETSLDPCDVIPIVGPFHAEGETNQVPDPSGPSVRPGPTGVHFDPLDVLPSCISDDPANGPLGRKVLQFYINHDMKAAGNVLAVMDGRLSDGLSAVGDDYDYWDEQRESYLALIRLADQKAVEFKVEYHKAVLEVEEKYNQIMELQKALKKKGQECSDLQEELSTTRNTYEQQIAVLSNHLAELNAKLAGVPRRK